MKTLAAGGDDFGSRRKSRHQLRLKKEQSKQICLNYTRADIKRELMAGGLSLAEQVDSVGDIC